MRYLILFFLIFNFSSAYAVPEKEAGELCGGWEVTGRTELDDQVFFECVETKMKDKRFVEVRSRKRQARKLCLDSKQGNPGICMRKMLAIPSHLAIKSKPKKKGRGVASKKKKK
jgi:hypothetical protein